MSLVACLLTYSLVIAVLGPPLLSPRHPVGRAAAAGDRRLGRNHDQNAEYQGDPASRSLTDV